MPLANAQSGTTTRPHIDLSATLQERAEGGRYIAEVPLSGPGPATDDKLFVDTPPPEGGWKGLARLLEALAPNVDTSLPLTPSQITDRISIMLDQGQNQQALDIIDRRMAQREASMAIGTDVQLLFLRGRALAALDRNDEAIEHYLTMTTLYPELPEPWNNLAAVYVKQGKLDMARDALQMALKADPRYPAAMENMGRVQLLLAQRSFRQAESLGAVDAGQHAQSIQSLVNQP